MTIIPEELEIHPPKKDLLEKLDNISIKEDVLFEKESDFFDIKVVQNSFGRFLKFKDTYQAGYFDSKYYKGNIPYVNYFLLPYLMNENIKNILLIGFGSGIIVNQYEKIFHNLEYVDIVDIDENVFVLAQKYFDFKMKDNFNFYLQDALVYLKTTKKKYDLIVVDVANDYGIDERFGEVEYLKLVKSRLNKGGIFVSNMPSSRDIFNKKNKFALDLMKKYKEIFKNVDIYSGEASNKIYYKTFFDIDECVFDITNLIFIVSDEKWQLSNDYSMLSLIGVDISPFVSDIISSG